MNWTRKGIIFEPPSNLNWMVSHAALPFAELTEEDSYRIYFSGRDAAGRSHIGWFELPSSLSEKAARISAAPSLTPGPLGAFDDSGTSNSWIVDHEGKKHLYYTGWSRGVTVPFYLFIGLAISEDGGESFYRASPAPILGRSRVDPYMTASPCVLIENGLWRMWYISCTGWKIENGRPKHYYHVKYAVSSDGVNWTPTGRVCLDYEDETEHAFGRPSVIRDNEIYRMWFPIRGSRYRIGYAESADGLVWSRRDAVAGLDVSDAGWDSEMTAYPHAFIRQGKTCMLYNGNDYGKTGIGLAELQE